MFLKIFTTVKGCLLLLSVLFSQVSVAGTLYLPLKLHPEIESRIEKLFLFANMPIIKRPIAVNDVLSALNKVDSQYPVLSQSIHFYLERYNSHFALSHSSAQYSTGESDGAAHVLDNARGLDIDNRYILSLQGYGIINDWLAIHAGVDHRRGGGDSQTDFDGTFLSFGWDNFQIDVGYRPHWLGPFQHSDALLSTNSATPLGVTVSNSEAIDFFDFKYEFAVLELSESDNIQSINDPDLRLSGQPKLFVSHVSFEPFSGFAFSANRIIQFGGNDKKESATDLLKSVVRLPSQNTNNENLTENDVSYQLSSISARFISQGRLPYSLYMTYAQEDEPAPSKAEQSSNALMLGVHLPALPHHFNLTIESAKFQNDWYANRFYGDGYRHEGNVLGHWAANFRPSNNTSKMQSHLVSLLWDSYKGLSFNGSVKHVRSINLAGNKAHGFEFSFDTSIAYDDSIIGLSLRSGENIEQENYNFISVSLRW